MKCHDVKIETMLASVHYYDWLEGSTEFGREFLEVILCCCIESLPPPSPILVSIRLMIIPLMASM